MTDRKKSDAFIEMSEKVTLWASATDGLLQRFMDAAAKNDLLACAITGGQLAQLGAMMGSFFKGLAEELADSPTQLKAVNQGIKLFAESFRQKYDSIGKDGFEQETAAALNRAGMN